MFNSPEEIKAEWLDYLEFCKKRTVEMPTSRGVVTVSKPLIPSVEGFCFHLGTTRETLREYGERDGFVDTIKGIRDHVFALKHQALINGDGSTIGLIFDMKANYGLVDRQTIDQNVSGGLKIDVKFNEENGNNV